MKNKFLFGFALLMFFGFVSNLEAQVTMSEVDGVYEVLPDMPLPPGGSMNSLYGYLQENLKYPVSAKEKGIEGLVAVAFIVREDGSITDAAVLRGIGGGCDEEALRVIKESGTWTPGKLDGKAVPVRMRLPIKFKL